MRIIIQIDIDKELWDKNSIKEISQYFIHNYGGKKFAGVIIEVKNPYPIIHLDVSEKVYKMVW